MDLCGPNNNFYYLLASAGYLTASADYYLASAMIVGTAALLASDMKECLDCHCPGRRRLHLKDDEHGDSYIYHHIDSYPSDTQSSSRYARNHTCCLYCNFLISSIRYTVWRPPCLMEPVRLSSAA